MWSSGESSGQCVRDWLTDGGRQTGRILLFPLLVVPCVRLYVTFSSLLSLSLLSSYTVLAANHVRSFHRRRPRLGILTLTIVVLYYNHGITSSCEEFTASYCTDVHCWHSRHSGSPRHETFWNVHSSCSTGCLTTDRQRGSVGLQLTGWPVSQLVWLPSCSVVWLWNCLSVYRDDVWTFSLISAEMCLIINTQRVRRPSYRWTSVGPVACFDARHRNHSQNLVLPSWTDWLPVTPCLSPVGFLET